MEDFLHRQPLMKDLRSIGTATRSQSLRKMSIVLGRYETVLVQVEKPRISFYVHIYVWSWSFLSLIET